MSDSPAISLRPRFTARCALLALLFAVSAGAADPPPDAAPILPEEQAAIRRHFALDEPWESLARAPAQVRRHRGLAALLCATLDPDAPPPEPIPPLAPARAESLLRSLFNGRDLLAEKRNEFGWAHYSPTDQSGQPLVLGIPRDYSPQTRYPLLVLLHGLGQRPRPDPDRICEEPVIRIWPWGRGDTGYRGLGARDVWDAIEAVQSWYSIDPDRILLMGFSMGGHGAWSLAARRPYRFAAVGAVSGWPLPDLLLNLRDLPVHALHGGRDETVPVFFSRYAHAVLGPVNPRFIYREVPGAGHGVRALDTDPIAQALIDAPPAGRRPLRFRIDHPADLSLPGLTGLAFDQPHQPAWIQIDPPAQREAGPRWTTRNLAKVRVAPPGPALLLDGQILTPAAGSPQTWIRTGTRWRPAPPAADAPRDYTSGAAAHLFEGEPLRIVIPAGGPAADLKTWSAAAADLARFAGAGKPMAAGAIPVCTDQTLTPVERRQCNLILLGSPHHHAEIRRLLPHLPIALSDRDEWILPGADRPFARTDNGLLLFHYHPLQPDRWIYLIIPPASPRLAREWWRHPDQLLVGADGLNRLNQPDLVVTSPRQGDRFWRRFGRDWQWAPRPDRPQRISASTLWEDSIRSAATAWIDAGRADLLLLGPPSTLVTRKIDPALFTEADAAAGRPDPAFALISLTPPALSRILGANRALQLHRPADAPSPLPSGPRRVLIPYDVIWSAFAAFPDLPDNLIIEPLNLPPPSHAHPR